MAYEQFDWCPTLDSGDSGVQFDVMVSRMGDGYEVRAAAGINPKGQTEPVTFRRDRATIALIAAFLDRHKGYKAFLYTPPDDVQGRFYCSGYTRRKLGGDNAQITATFIKTF